MQEGKIVHLSDSHTLRAKARQGLAGSPHEIVAEPKDKESGSDILDQMRSGNLDATVLLISGGFTGEKLEEAIFLISKAEELDLKPRIIAIGAQGTRSLGADIGIGEHSFIADQVKLRKHLDRLDEPEPIHR